MRLTGRSTFSKIPSFSQTRIVGATDAHAQYLALTCIQQSQKTIIVLPTFREVSQWASIFAANDALLRDFDAEAAILPFWSLWGADRFVNQMLTKRQRVHALSALLDPERRVVILTTLQGLGQKSISPERFSERVRKFSVGEHLDQDNFLEYLDVSGYRSASAVEEEGVYSARGSIIDVFSPNYQDAIRFEFNEESVSSIRMFSVDDQKSRKSIQSITVVPALEMFILPSERKAARQKVYDYLLSLTNVPTHDIDGFMEAYNRSSNSSQFDILAPLLCSESATGFDFAQKAAAVIFPKTIDACKKSYLDSQFDFERAWELDVQGNKISLNPNQHFEPLDKILERVTSQKSIVDIGSPLISAGAVDAVVELTTAFQGISGHMSAAARFDQWFSAIESIVRIDHGTVIIFASNLEHQNRIESLLNHRAMSCTKVTSVAQSHFDSSAKPQSSGQIIISIGDLSNWIWLDEDRTLFLPEHELSGIAPKKVRTSSSRLKNYLSSFRDLKVGDLVVHILHGIGRYQGMSTMKVANILGDFLQLEYFGGDKIYLPVDKLNLLQRYSSSGDADSSASLDRLGSGGWERRRLKVKQSVKDMADKLLKLQAERAVSKHHVYAKPNDDYFKFESEFPYEETEDQLKSIQEINHDLEASSSMDRLICGDVGFGKTEVALRAAFRVVSEGLQVLILVPTTILCYQHFRTFSDRLGRHGIKVGQLNRFVSAKTVKEVLDGLATGRIDVVVGTHKILNKSLKVKRLGLLIVDEEQKFGVIHKERLKELRAGADILTLTATPIPRTMHMAMLGLRDISIISTPPHNRLSVRTFVAKFEESLIKTAIEQEVARGGQVFFVHNRVEDIAEITAFVKSLAPKAEVRFAHGQMKEQDLERTIIDFIELKFDVLVCTTIIESGVDMPNVNTMIVNNADRFGLAQLYQMRGRVGRSSMQAYAYFLTKNPGDLSDDARKRLEVLSMHQELGSGFQIASHDLEIRGAGNLLGVDQSGHASEVGLETYTDLLNEAIAELKGQEPPPQKIDTEIKLPVTAMLNQNYVPAEGQRLQLYKSLFSVDSFSEIEVLESEVEDRFGPLPDDAKKLFGIARIKYILSQAGAHQISLDRNVGAFEVKFGSLQERQIDIMIKVVNQSPASYRLSPDYRLFIYWDALREHNATSLKELDLISGLIDLLNPIAIEMGIL
jgi:transcription-repair coupling factor (superfamily II helicase)